MILSFLAWAWQAVWISFGSVCIRIWAWVGRTGCWVYPAGLRSVGLRVARCQMPTKEQAGGGAASLNDASRTVLSVSEAFSSCDINQCCYCDGETSDTIIYLHFHLSLSLTIIHALFSACLNPCLRQMLNWSHIRSCIQVCLCHLYYHANLLLPSTSCRQGIKTAVFCRADINLVKVDCTNLLKWGLNLNALFKHACVDAHSSPRNKSTQNNLRHSFSWMWCNIAHIPSCHTEIFFSIYFSFWHTLLHITEGVMDTTPYGGKSL